MRNVMLWFMSPIKRSVNSPAAYPEIQPNSDNTIFTVALGTSHLARSKLVL